MELERVLTILWTFVMGVFIVWGYFEILYRRIYVQTEGRENVTNKWLLAGFYWGNLYFYVWCVFALLATFSFFGLFFDLIWTREWTRDKDGVSERIDVGGIVVSYNCFLFFSSLFSFLVFRVFKEAKDAGGKTFFSRLLVIADLFCVAAAAWCMVGFICQDFSDKWWLVLFSVLLAFHCTFIDLVFWGYTWFYHSTVGIHHDSNPTLIFSAAIDTDPSTMGIFTRLRIRRADVPLLA